VERRQGLQEGLSRSCVNRLSIARYEEPLRVHLVAIQALSQTVIHLTQGGRFRQAADREKEIAQIYLQEQNDLRRACESFERAGEWYAQEDATAYVVCFSAL
jgi:Soluble NSF attachment protein, SNAP